MDNATLISIFSLSLGFLSGITLLCIKLLFKSKCSNLNFLYGCIKIQRDIKSEVECEKIELSNIDRSKIEKRSSMTNINEPIV